MLDRKKVVHSKAKFIFFLLVLIASAFVLPYAQNSEAANDRTKRKIAKRANQKLTTDLKLSGFQAELFSGAVKLSWQTSVESGIVGYRVWREAEGQNLSVNPEIVGGSVLQAANGILENGGEYAISDRDGSYHSLYRLEAIALGGESQWFGPFSVQTGDESAGRNINLPDYENPATGAFGQINRVDLVESEDNSLFYQPEDFAGVTNDAAALKFDIRQNGWYRIDWATLQSNGFQKASSNSWKLFADGVEQAMLVNTDGSIEFYGRGIDTLYSDSKVYWLKTGGASGRRIGRATQKFVKQAQSGYSRTTSEKRDRVLRAPGILNGERENWYAGLINANNFSQTLNIGKIATGSGETATLSVDLQGLGGVPHQVSVMLNGISVGQIAFNYTDRKEWSVSVPLSRLVEGVNTITLRSSSSSDLSFLEAVRINYPRRLEAENNRMEFQTPRNKAVKLEGFTDRNIRFFDITNPASVTEYTVDSRLESNGTYTFTLPSFSSARVFEAQPEATGTAVVNQVTVNTPSDWRNTYNQADFVIIAPREHFPILEPLKSAREAEGIRTVLVDIVDIYDEFNNGVKSAVAIKDFLKYAKQSWMVKPSYVMVAGDSSVDPRNYSGLGGGNKDIVPTMFTDTWNLETVTDESLVDFNGDSIGEMSIGRLPFTTAAELTTMVEKILYIQPLSPAELNAHGVTFVSDAPQGYDFAAASRRIASPLPSNVVPNYIDRGNQDSAVVRNNILNSVNSGAAIVNYFGHGQVYNWTNGNILRNTDAPSMNNLKRPSLMTMIACLNGAFAETSIEGLAEAVMKAQTGGAFATWSSSATNIADEQEYLAKEFYTRVFAGKRLGDAARETKTLTSFTDIRLTYLYFGDPTQRLVASSSAK